MPVTPSNGAWWVELLARGLKAGERETVLGDLAEAGETGARAFLSVAGLLMWRQLQVWRSWAPWVAAFGLAMPASFLLMGFSVSIAQAYQAAAGGTVLQATGGRAGAGLTMLLCNIGLLAAWSATAGLAVGTISRRTIWASAAFSLLACGFCLARFRIDSLSRLSLLIFLPPAIAGLCFGLRNSRIRFGALLAAAMVTTALTLPHWNKPGAWLPNCILSWPAWYLVATAWGRRVPQRSGFDGK